MSNNVIDEVLDSFDFERVHAVMAWLNWEWISTGVPSVLDLKAEAHRLLEDLHKSDGSLVLKETGGFRAERRIDGEVGFPRYTLSFVLTSRSAHDDYPATAQ